MRSRFQTLLVPLTLAVLCIAMFLVRAAGGEPATVFTAPPADAVPVGSSLTLAEALRLALAHNPELAMARLEVQALEGAETQAGARPIPSWACWSRTPQRHARTTPCSGLKPSSWRGKRSARLAAAASAREQAGVALLARQAEVRAAVTSAFFALLGAQEQVRLSQMSLELASKTSGVATRRLQAGKVPPLEQAKAQVAEAGARADLAQANSELSLARHACARFGVRALLSSPRLRAMPKLCRNCWPSSAWANGWPKFRPSAWPDWTSPVVKPSARGTRQACRT